MRGCLRRFGDVERGLAHAEGIEQALLLELVQRLSRHDLDDAAEHVGRMAVVPFRARLLRQRQFRDPLDEFGIAEIGVEQIGFGIEPAHGIVAVEAIGQAGGVTQQILIVIGR